MKIKLLSCLLLLSISNVDALQPNVIKNFDEKGNGYNDTAKTSQESVKPVGLDEDNTYLNIIGYSSIAVSCLIATASCYVLFSNLYDLYSSNSNVNFHNDQIAVSMRLMFITGVVIPPLLLYLFFNRDLNKNL